MTTAITPPSPVQPIFVSYARADAEPLAAHLRDALLAAGVSVWWDRACMESLRDGTGAPCGLLRGHTAARIALAWLPDCTLVSAARDGRPIGWNPNTAKPRWTIDSGTDDSPELLAFNTVRGSGVVVGDWQGRLAVWDLVAGERVCAMRAGGPVRSLAVGPKPGELLVGTEDAFELWTTSPSPTRLARTPVGGYDREEHFVVGIAAVASGHVLCASTEGGLYRLPAERRAGDDADDEARLHEAPVAWCHPTAIAASVDGKIAVVTTRRAKCAVVYDASGELTRLGEFHGDSDMLSCACNAADATVIAVADAAGSVHALRRRPQGR